MRKFNKMYWFLAFSVGVILCTELGVAVSNIDTKGPDDITSNTQIHSSNANKEGGTELIPDPVTTLLLVSTLDGSLTALDRVSGQIRWISKDEPMIRVPSSSGQSDSVRPPFFLPDPKSGQLYVLGRHRHLKKLPFTIPQLVSMSPCRSTEGLLYSGKKMDLWLNLNPLTGEKSEMFPNSQSDSTCPAPDGSTTKNSDGSSSASTKPVLIGKSEYTISMMDGPRQWNVTFHDYSSVDMNPQTLQDYNLVHFTSPSTGAVLTYERESGQLLWQAELETPVIALYTIDCTHSALTSVPFQSIAVETLNRLKVAHDTRDNQLSPTLYVGEFPYGLYAVPSLVDDTVLPISAKTTEFPYLLEGPTTERIDTNNIDEVPNNTNNENEKDADGDIILLGHYEVPENPEIRIPPIRQIAGTDNTPNSEETIVPRQVNDSDTESDKIIPSEEKKKLGKDSKLDPKGHKNPVSPNKIAFPPPPAPKLTLNPGEYSDNRKEKPYIVVTTAVISTVVTIAVISLGYVTITTIKKHNNSGVTSEPSSQKSLSNEDRDTFPDTNGLYPMHSALTKSADGSVVTIGKIAYEPKLVLGKGCDGTFVYKGTFDNREVAVKRILPDCIAYAIKEVEFLRQSDGHGNVIRYYWTESDGQFQYIALELCLATLNDWVGNQFSHETIRPLQILREATEGLAYLHLNNIVHRDIKPANILLTLCPDTKNIKAKISDFGLCKKLTSGRNSFSKQTGGISGTEGWIAPEVLRNLSDTTDTSTDKLRMTHSVDIFSLGCVYYYILTKGDHPFGDPYLRQSNILMGKSILEKIANNPQGANELISLMISNESSERPPLKAILKHPIFWSGKEILDFFTDASNRIEQKDETIMLIRHLERGGVPIVKTNWTDYICDSVKEDLRGRRTYQGNSVRDLLRAIRNKSNHYTEVDPKAKAALGELPNEFVMYWLQRFPTLLLYTWLKFECIKEETRFKKFYHENHKFYELSKDVVGSDDYEEDATNNTKSYENSPTKDFYTPPDSGINSNWRSSSPSTNSPQRKLDTTDIGKSKSQHKYNYRKRNNGINKQINPGGAGPSNPA